MHQGMVVYIHEWSRTYRGCLGNHLRCVGRHDKINFKLKSRSNVPERTTRTTVLANKSGRRSKEEKLREPPITAIPWKADQLHSVGSEKGNLLERVHRRHYVFNELETSYRRRAPGCMRGAKLCSRTPTKSCLHENRKPDSRSFLAST